MNQISIRYTLSNYLSSRSRLSHSEKVLDAVGEFFYGEPCPTGHFRPCLIRDLADITMAHFDDVPRFQRRIMWIYGGFPYCYGPYPGLVCIGNWFISFIKWMRRFMLLLRISRVCQDICAVSD